MKKNTKILTWFFINILILVYGTYLYKIDTDGAIVLIYLMVLITFPLGYLSTLILYFISKFHLSETIFLEYPIIESIILPWVIFVIFGYIQWFILFPKIITYIKKLMR